MNSSQQKRAIGQWSWPWFWVGGLVAILVLLASCDLEGSDRTAELSSSIDLPWP